MKIFIVSFFIAVLFSGCLSTVMLVGTASSTALTAQEIEKKYDGDIIDYISDKSKILYKYINEKVNDNK